jgi:hypothetical protein
MACSSFKLSAVLDRRLAHFTGNTRLGCCRALNDSTGHTRTCVSGRLGALVVCVGMYDQAAANQAGIPRQACTPEQVIQCGSAGVICHQVAQIAGMV